MTHYSHLVTIQTEVENISAAAKSQLLVFLSV